MVYVKRLVMHGFKSFVRKTEILFTPGINVILGPNGSGKSNISDALCFVLGRLSAKSMRAARAKNLIFMGTKFVAPAKESMVEIVFDNSDKEFSLDKKEISIKRIVRKSGQSIYKINNETKTRQQVLTLLAQAGIDPNGFNIILQGEIQNFVKMHPDERRRIIEEVSGISVYEIRKEKSLKELAKIDEKLKEINSILKERTAYLNNLERERQQALRFKRLEKDVKRYHASIIYLDLGKKKKEHKKIIESILKRKTSVDKIKKSISGLRSLMQSFESRIESINSLIQESAGVEQEKLNQEIADIRAELTGLGVRLDNSNKKTQEITRQKKEIKNSIEETEKLIKELQKKSPIAENKFRDLAAKKKELEQLEERRKKFYMLKSELKSIKERLEDKKSILQNYQSESEFLLKQIKSISLELFDAKSDRNKLDKLKSLLNEKRSILKSLNQRETEIERIVHSREYEIENQEKIIEKISKMDICPVCKSKITNEHLSSIKKEVLPAIEKLKQEVEGLDKELNSIYKKKEILSRDIEQMSFEIAKRESDLIKLSNINGKKEQIKSLYERMKNIKQEINELLNRRKSVERKIESEEGVEKKYETVRIDVQEISMRSGKNINSEISFKQREVERFKISLKQLIREEEDVKEEIIILKNKISKKEDILEKKKKQDEELGRKFKKLLEEKESFTKKIKDAEIELAKKSNDARNIEEEVNNLKIDKARIDAEIGNLETEILRFGSTEIIKTSKEILIKKLERTKEILAKIGSVNLRSLEVYDTIKEEYDKVKNKAEVIINEKESVMKIIHEIDIKKKRVFMKTLSSLNEIFSRNFAQLSTKGQVTLELENKKNPFEGGVNIIVKMGHGKYFDITSLSGGEQTLVALSLIFAIQELNPYCFYVLDEIDAALDKRNSERLASLLKKYMQKGQYIVITHNDEIIMNATNLYGVSMHEGISKIISLKL